MDSFQDQIFIDHQDDLFDRLPDEIVLSIFNKLHDAKSLCLSMCVCKRFHSIAPQIDDVFLPIPRRKTVDKESDQETQKNSFKNLVIKTLIKPLHFISQMMKSKSKNEENDADLHSFYVPNEVLKPFSEMRSLHLRLPCHGNRKPKQGKNNFTTFLKWKAEFGTELHSCVMLGAKSVTEKPDPEEKRPENTDPGSERVIADEELKLRIVWTISCLIAASARHFLIQETVKQQKSIESVVVSDESEQGKLSMNRGQIEELREAKAKGEDDEGTEYRSRVPALRMKMWYLQRLELPDSGKVMEGATLVEIRPAAGGDKVGKGRSEVDDVAAAFGGEKDGKVIEEAIRKLMVAKKCYTLEMNAF